MVPGVPTRTGPVASESALPRVYAPTVSRSQAAPARKYPWKKDIVATIFWIGEEPSPRNPVPNAKSSWDTNWQRNYGGYDDPAPENRTAHYCPTAFTPGLNPFYIALPYNDVMTGGKSKPESSKVIPWHAKHFDRPGRTVLKSRWIAIEYKGKVCFAQWEDCGPFVTNDYEYVFGTKRPKNKKNNGAGIDISPAVRDFLGLQSGGRCNWRFVELPEVGPGPWMLLGENNHFVHLRRHRVVQERERMKELERLRDEWFQKNPLPWERQ